MSDRVDNNDIQAFFRFTNVEGYLKNDNEKAAYKKYQNIYHELLNAEYKKRAYEDLYKNIRFTHHSQKTIDGVKEIVALEKEIQKLESELGYMEQSKLFQNIHHRALYGEKRNFIVKIKDNLSTFLKRKNAKKDLIKCIAYFLFLLWIDVTGNIVKDSYSGILSKIFFAVGIVILSLYITFNFFIKKNKE